MTQAGRVGRLIQELQRVDPSAGCLLSLHEQAVAALRDVQSDLSHYADRLEINPERLAELEERMNLVQSLKRKYGGTIEEVIAFGEEAQKKLHSLEQRDTELTFPDRDFATSDIDRYNRVLIEETEYIRDFLVLHYKATDRDDSPFWDYCRNMPIPERLDEKLRVYKNNGRTFREHDELFNDTSWFAVLTGQCGAPRTYDPVANLLSLDETKTRLNHIREATANSADYMSNHRKFIEENCAA
jgi:hypothetical protein